MIAAFLFGLRRLRVSVDRPAVIDRLSQLAEAVADGCTLDWDALESSASDDAELVSVRRLRAIADIGRAHSQLTLSESTSASVSVRTILRPLDDGCTPATWGTLRLLERVGRGRFGDVYRAWDPTLAREVALKLYRHRDNDAVVKDNDVVEEGRLMARVRHPNVVTVHGARRIDGRTGLWMEFVDGQTLEDELRNDGLFAATAIVDVGVQLCRALTAVHQAGLVHRDVKAQNVMRTRQGRVLLGDFGTGTELIDDGQRPHEMAGTPAYIAPEVLRGAPATPQSDTYSLGVLLFHLATGTYPVSARSLSEIRTAHDRGSRVGLNTVRNDLPSVLVSAIERALGREPADRFPDAADFQAALDQTFRSHSLVSHIRSRRGATIAVASSIGVIAAAVFMTRFWDGPRATQRRSPTAQDVAQPNVTLNAGPVSAEVRQAPGEGPLGPPPRPLLQPSSENAGITNLDRAPMALVPSLGSAQDYSAAAERLLRKGAVAEARRYAAAMAGRFPDDPLSGPWWRLTFEARAAWLELDARAALKAANGVAALRAEDKPAAVGVMLPPLFVGLGRLRQAEQFASELPPAKGFLESGGSRELSLASILPHFADPGALRQFVNDTPLQTISMNSRLDLLVRAGLVDEAEAFLLKIRGPSVPPMRLERAAIAVARGRPREALELLGDLSDPKEVPVFRVARVRALALDALGDDEQAIMALTSVDVPRFVVSGSTALGAWLEHRALLARLLRRSARIEEARAIEDELRKMLAVADDDHPIVQQLRNVE